MLGRESKIGQVLRLFPFNNSVILWLSGWETTISFSILRCQRQLLSIYVILTYVCSSPLASYIFNPWSLLPFFPPSSLSHPPKYYFRDLATLFFFLPKVSWILSVVLKTLGWNSKSVWFDFVSVGKNVFKSFRNCLMVFLSCNSWLFPLNF